MSLFWHFRVTDAAKNKMNKDNDLIDELTKLKDVIMCEHNLFKVSRPIKLGGLKLSVKLILLAY